MGGAIASVRARGVAKRVGANTISAPHGFARARARPRRRRTAGSSVHQSWRIRVRGVNDDCEEHAVAANAAAHTADRQPNVLLNDPDMSRDFASGMLGT